MKQYLELLRRIRDCGRAQGRSHRHRHARRCSGSSCASTSRAGFPLVTTKKMHLRSVVYELLWFLRGETNVAWLHEHGVTIWDEWADAQGELGPVYGKQWRAGWPPTAATSTRSRRPWRCIRANPDSRRIIVSAWNVGELERMALHAVPRVLPVLRGRAAPVLPAVPAQRRRVPRRAVQHRQLRAAAAHVRAAVRPRRPANWSGPAATATCTSTTSSRPTCSSSRTPLPLPQLSIRRRPPSIFDYDYEDFEFVNYQHHAPIKAPVAV